MCGLCGLLGYLSVLIIFYPFISACCKTPCLLFAHHVTRKTLKITRKRGFFCGLRMTVRCYFSYSPAGYNRAFAGYKCPFAGYVRVIGFLYIHAINTLIHRITRITRNFFITQGINLHHQAGTSARKKHAAYPQSCPAPFLYRRSLPFSSIPAASRARAKCAGLNPFAISLSNTCGNV